MYLVFTFPDRGELTAESIVPLKFHGEWMRDQGWDNPVEVVFMTGFETLSDSYKQELVDLGYRLTDMGAMTKMIEEACPVLTEMLPYFRYTFLRWVLLFEMVKRELITLPLVMIGGDVIFTTDPGALYEEVKSKTFVLQGCPDFVAISNHVWLETYHDEFFQYLSSPKEYHGQKHFELKDVRVDREYCNLSCYELPLRHDQDLIQFLVRFSDLPQETTNSSISDSNYYWMQNPLFPTQWHIEQMEGAPFVINEKNGQFYVGDRLLPFLHLQGDFSRCALAWMGLNKIGLGFLSDFILTGYASETNSLISRIILKSGSFFMEGRKKMSRRDIAEFLFSRNMKTGNLFFVDVIYSFSNSCGINRKKQ